MTVGSNTQLVAVSPLTGDVYVTNVGSGEGDVSVISGRTNKVIPTVPDDYGPVGIAVSPLTSDAYAGNAHGGTVTLINGRTNKIIGAYQDGINQYDFGGISVNPGAGTMYATNNAGKAVEISARTGKAIGTLPFGLPIVSPRTGDLYVSNEPVDGIGDSTVVVYAP